MAGGDKTYPGREAGLVVSCGDSGESGWRAETCSRMTRMGWPQLRTSPRGSSSRAGERFSTNSPDTFTQTVPSPNFKPLAAWRRTISLADFRTMIAGLGIGDQLPMLQTPS